MKRNALKELEAWVNEKKGRYVREISIDPGYMATCWSITIGNVDAKPQDTWWKESDWAKKNNRAEIYASETNFLGYEEPLSPNVVFVVDDKDDWTGWPGLEKTILAAIDKANELGL